MKAENFWQAIRDKIKHLIEADDLMGPDTIGDIAKQRSRLCNLCKSLLT